MLDAIRENGAEATEYIVKKVRNLSYQIDSLLMFTLRSLITVL